MVTIVPRVTNWSVTPQNGQVNYFTLMNTWLFESTSVIDSLNNVIEKINEAGEDINNIGQNAINAITFDNIAQLKVNSNMGRVDILGYYTKGDGGGGTFYWDSTSTEANNDGTIIQATGVITGRWKRVYSGAVNVKWFGAKGDGITDDRQAFNNCSSYCYDVQVKMYLDGDTYYLSQTWRLPSSLEEYNEFSFDTNGTTIVCGDTLNKTIIIPKHADGSFNRNIYHTGKLTLKFSSYTENSIGMNLGNQYNCSYGYITVENCETSFFGKSVFGTSWDVFHSKNALKGFILNPLASQSAGTACTSLVGSVYVDGAKFGIEVTNLMYSNIDGYVQGYGQVPIAGTDLAIALHLVGCQATTFKLGIENFTGCLARVSGSNSFATLELNPQLLAINNWDTSLTYTNIPQVANALISVAASNSIELKDVSLATNTFPLDSSCNIKMIYIEEDSKVKHTGGFLFKDTAQTNVTKVSGSIEFYIPSGVRYNDLSNGDSLTSPSTLPMEGLHIQTIPVWSNDIVTAGGKLIVPYNKELSMQPVAIFTQWVTPVETQETYTNVSVVDTTVSQTKILSNAPNGYWLNVIVIGKIY